MNSSFNHDEQSGSDHAPDDRSLLILYATETGTAQDAADRIARECRRIHFKCRLSSMNAYPLASGTSVPKDRMEVELSTTGSGTEPRSMTPLWRQLLRSDLPPDLFEDLAYASFGLGDSSYEKFCWPSKLLARRLESLGGTELCKRGDGDEQDSLGIEGALEPWIDSLLQSLLQLYPLSPGVDIISTKDTPLPRASLHEVSEVSCKSLEDPLVIDNNYHTGTVRCNRRITADDWNQDVRHFEFDFVDNIQYNPGDVAVIHPEASPVEVESFLISMGWVNSADTLYKIEHSMLDQSLPDHLPPVATLRQIFTRYVNFNAVPRRSFFQLLRRFTSDELEQETLDDFLSKEGADDLYEYCFRVRRTIQEVLTEFRSAKIPKEYIFDLFPPMRPREFSIASSIKLPGFAQRHPHQIHLCVAIVKYRTKLRIPRRGVCTTFLAALHPGDSLRIGLNKGLITLPKDTTIPIICVGPGTGVAPMRAVIEDRIDHGSTQNMLYFGCRHATKDQHYCSEFQSYATKRDLRYRVACSRDGPEGVKRTYVQDLIEEDGDFVWKMLGTSNGGLYISGSSNKMPAGVKQAVRIAAQQHGGKTEDEARDFITKMEREGRLVEECWN